MLLTRILCTSCGAHWDTPSADPQGEAYREFFKVVSHRKRPDGSAFIQGVCNTCWTRSLFPPREEIRL